MNQSLYAPSGQSERLRAFRAAHPEKTVRLDDADWHYIDTGHGDETVLLLVGALRVADAAFRSIPMLEDAYRVITPTYPPVTTMAQLADGLAGILDHEGLGKTHMLAGSFGGMVAQVFAQQHGDRVDKLILSTTTVLDENSAQRYKEELYTLSPLPDEIVRAGAKVRFLEMITPPEQERDFWRDYLDELLTYRLGKDDLISTYRCLIDFAEHYKSAQWPGKMLILESDDDQTFNAEARHRLRAQYPQAEVHTFHGAGHSPGTTKRDEYFAVVKRFLANRQSQFGN
jgi:pimeloyl-ACP methyl ester carboxylesterase